MQTFLPYASFKRCAIVLDNNRHNNQIQEALVLWRTLNGFYSGRSWSHHPACKMWAGYENALALYRNMFIDQWIEKGFNNNREKTPMKGKLIMPPWWGDYALHAGYRSILYNKDPVFYSRYGWDGFSPFEWPV